MSKRSAILKFGCSVLVVALSILVVPAFAQATFDEIDISLKPINAFKRNAPNQTKFGAFTFKRGAILSAGHWTFGAYSGLRILENGNNLLAVSDRGHWLRAKIERDADGDLTGMKNAVSAPVLNSQGQRESRKFKTDVEALALKDDRVFISYERLNIIREFGLNNGPIPSNGKNLAFRTPAGEIRQNEGMEALAISPDTGPLAGAMVALTEGSINLQGNMFAFIVNGPKSGIFYVQRTDRFDITDADFLPNGDLMILERRFTFRDGLNMRIRLIDANQIQPGATVNGPELLNANLEYTIDNMEGLSVWQNSDGETMVSLISDDNQNFLQSTVYLEFRYDGLDVRPRARP